MNVSGLPFRLGLVIVLGTLGGAAHRAGPVHFDHEKHSRVFPECQSCHAGIEAAGRPVYPAPETCANCHDGVVEKKVDWTPPATRPTNFRFTHADHRRESGKRLTGDSAVACSDCHTPSGGQWLTVRRTIQAQCFTCHGLKVAHFAAPDSVCGVCHLTLAEATSLPESRIAKFEKPASHDDPGFLGAKGHGKLTEQGGGSCAVCHAREFCTQCHVNAPEIKAIQALASDARSLALKAELKAPSSHQETRWISRHGGQAKRRPADCAFCHTQESCVACHRTRPAVVLSLPAAGPGRAVGARVERRKPGYHSPDFADRHAPIASASPGTCTACHARAECLECHRPNPGASSGYHPAGFLVRHPAAAFNRQADCAGCHNQATFCVACHQQAGMTSSGRLQPGYHDANGAFLLNHGVAARQNIESCVGCHSERDCLACHSAQAGRHFNPHGPGFDPERLKRRNPQTCSACHGRNIPGG